MHRLGFTAAILGLLAATVSASSIEEAVLEIDQLRDQAERLDAVHEEKGNNVYQVSLRTVQPGTGPQLTTLRLYLGESREREEQIFATYFLRKVTAAYNVSGREFRSEYLFSGTTAPEMVFHQAFDGATETRIYFESSRPLTVVRVEGFIETEARDETPDTLSEADLETAEAVLDRARQYLALFEELERTLAVELGG